MSTLAWIAVVLAAWIALAVALGLLVGRVASLNDRLGAKR